MNASPELSQILSLLMEDPQFGAILPTTDTLTLLDAPSEYHIRKHRESGALQENIHFFKHISPIDNVGRIYYTLAGLVKLCELGVGSRPRQVYETLMQWKPRGQIIPVGSQAVQPYQVDPAGQPTTYSQQGFYDQPEPAYAGIDRGGPIAHTPTEYPYPITQGVGNSPVSPSDMIGMAIEGAVERVLGRHSAGYAQDANAHQVSDYMFRQQEQTLRAVEAGARIATGASIQTLRSQPMPVKETTIFQSVQPAEKSQNDGWLFYGGIAICLLAAGIFWIAGRTTARQDSAPTYQPQQLEVRQ